jgi:ketosteroid isomerase-like protein
MNNLEIVKKTYRDFATGDVDAVLDVFDPNITWNQCQGFPQVDWDGVLIGPEAIVKHIFAPLAEIYDGFHIEIDDLFAAGDKVVMQGHYIGKWTATGKDFRANAVHIWTAENGKLTHFFQAVDTAEIVNA